MDGLWFYDPFNRILVISCRQKNHHERLCATESSRHRDQNPATSLVGELLITSFQHSRVLLFWYMAIETWTSARDTHGGTIQSDYRLRIRSLAIPVTVFDTIVKGCRPSCTNGNWLAQSAAQERRGGGKEGIGYHRGTIGKR